MQALWFEEYADGTVFREVIHGLFFNKVIRPKILNTPGDQAAIDTILHDALPRCSAIWRSRSPGSISRAAASRIADIAVVSNLINFHYLGYAIDRHPRLAALFRADDRRASIAAALEAEQGIVCRNGPRSLLRAGVGRRVI